MRKTRWRNLFGLECNCMTKDSSLPIEIPPDVSLTGHNLKQIRVMATEDKYSYHFEYRPKIY